MILSLLLKAVAFTCDNASNIHVAARHMDIIKIGSFARTLNLAAGKLVHVNSVRNWLANIKAIVVWYKKVHLAKVVLGEMQTRLSLPEHKLLLKCEDTVELLTLW